MGTGGRRKTTLRSIRLLARLHKPGRRQDTGSQPGLSPLVFSHAQLIERLAGFITYMAGLLCFCAAIRTITFTGRSIYKTYSKHTPYIVQIISHLNERADMVE